MTLRILLSAEVAEEVHELMAILRSRADDVVLVVPDSLHVDSVESVVRTHRIADAAYGSRRAKVRALRQFVAIARAERPDVILSGFSMLKHRLTARLLGVPHVAYLRGLLFDASIRSGLSDAIAGAPVVGRALGDLANAYSATHVWTIGDLNRDFLLERSIPAESISLVGPVWLDGVAPVGRGPRRDIVLTSALAAHGSTDLHELQTTALRAIAAEPGDTPLVLRVHPRDFYPYESDPAFSGVRLDRTSPYSFLRTLTTGDRVLSPASTLGFESAYVGADVRFYRLATDRLSRSDTILDAQPLRRELLRAPHGVSQSASRAFSPIDFGVARTWLASLDRPA